MSDVIILMGSKNDFTKIKSCVDVLKQFGVSHQARVMSAHRTPERVEELIAKSTETKVYICAAGCAAHLAGVVASQTVLPVIGIPVDAGPLQGFDALLSTVQMPGGVPVAGVSIGSAGAKNAAILAIQMMSLADDNLKEKLLQYRKDMKAKIAQDDASLQDELNA